MELGSLDVGAFPPVPLVIPFFLLAPSSGPHHSLPLHRGLDLEEKPFLHCNPSFNVVVTWSIGVLRKKGFLFANRIPALFVSKTPGPLA